jgi:DNA invertase Pin-like site-specific DNA recombinase
VKAIAICRVSSKKQEENNHSLTQQDDSVTNMATVLSAEIVKSWSMAVSAKKGNNLKRKDLQQALNYCRYNRGVKFLLIDKVSRFARELKMIFYYMVEFEKMGVKVVFCHPSQQKFNADTAEAMYELARKAYEAEAENEERSDTSTTKMKARVALGYYPFHSHQGYKKTPLEDGLHVPDKPRYSLLQTALKATAALEWIPEEAVKWLDIKEYRTPIAYKNKNGVRVQTGNKKLDIDHFRGIMKEPYYAGIIEIEGWPINEHGLHEPMITVEEWEINKAIALNRKPRVKQQFNPKFRLNKSWHTPCRHNDGKLTGINHTNGKGWWREEYVCRACNKRIAKELVHEAMTSVLERTKPSPEASDGFIAAINKVWCNAEAYRIERRQELEVRKLKLNEDKGKLIVSLTEYPDLAGDIQEQIASVKAQIVEADIQLIEVNSVDDDYREFIRYALSYIENLRHKWWELPKYSFEKCKNLLFNDEILVAPEGKVYTPQLSPIYTLLNENDDPKVAENSNMVELPSTALGSVSLSWLVVYRHSPLRVSRRRASKRTK